MAYNIDAHWGKGVPLKGMERIAKIAHKHNIPVTWLVDPVSGKAMKEKIDEWHEKYGDDIALNWEKEFETSEGEDFKKALNSLKTIFPWSKVETMAGGRRSNKMLEHSKREGQTAIWGSCWEQLGVDNITDRGAQWGYFYTSDDNYKEPSSTMGRSWIRKRGSTCFGIIS